jgi:hypothetical protein
MKFFHNLKQKKWMRFPLTIQYDPEVLPDGFGAQAIRIIGIYSIAEKYRLNYRHQGITYIPPQELVGFPFSQAKYVETLNALNELLYFPSTRRKKGKSEIVLHLRSISRRLLAKLIFQSLFSRKKMLIKLCLPQGITDVAPNILNIGAEVARRNFLALLPKNSSSRIVIHLRGGLRTVDTKRPQLSPSYYDKSLRAIGTNRNDQLVIHSDFMKQDFLAENLGLRTELYKNWLDEIGTTFNNVEVKLYSPMLEVITDMVTAECLVMSNSALSYFAGLLNDKRVIWPPLHGHSKLQRWEMGPDLGDDGGFIDPNHIPFIDWEDPAGKS